MVHLVGRSADEELVRPMLVVPVEMARQFSPHFIASQWNGDAARTLILECTDEAFDHSDAAILSDGTEAWPDSLALTPSFEAGAPELTAFVADDVLGFRFGIQTAEEGADFNGSRLLLEDRDAHGSP